MISTYPSTDDVNFNHLIKMIPARFIHCKLYLLEKEISKNLCLFLQPQVVFSHKSTNMYSAKDPRRKPLLISRALSHHLTSL